MNNGILSKEDILCMQYSRMKSSQIMNPNLAPEEFPTPPNEVCCWPGCRREETCWQKRTKMPILCSGCRSYST